MGKKSRQGQQKLQQQQQEEVGDDRWEAVARRLAAELCPGCGEYGHTVAICPSQYREEPERPVREDLHPPKRTNALSSEGVWDWLGEPGGGYEEALPAVINLLWARDGERWETWEQQHHPASLPDIAAMVLNYLAADMGGVPPSPGKKGEAPLPSPAPEGEESPLPSPAPKGEEPSLPSPEEEAPPRYPEPAGEGKGKVWDDGWEAVARHLAAELCPGCGEYGHTVAICPSQYREEPERPTPEWEQTRRGEPVHPAPRRGEPMHPTLRRGEPVHPAPRRREPVHPVPRRGEPIGPEPRPPGAEQRELPLPPPPPSLPPLGAEPRELPLPTQPGAEQQELPLSPTSPPLGAEQQELPLSLPPLGAEQQELPLSPTSPPLGAEQQELPLSPPPLGAEQQELPLSPPPPGAEQQELPLSPPPLGAEQQ
ncbi:UNVERIFIED_CONTAM: hypothetical protein FKN15_013029 [Acipenser sinensis]